MESTTNQTTADESKQDIDAVIEACRMAEKLQPDYWHGPYPLWHGWALTDAFLAGVEYQKRRDDV